MKTNNPFIAAACDQAGEVCALDKPTPPTAHVSLISEGKTPAPAHVPVPTGCSCLWNGGDMVQRCELHEAWKEAIHEWAARAKQAEAEISAKRQAEQESPVWEATTPAFKKYITQSRYERFQPGVQKWYRPITPSPQPTQHALTDEQAYAAIAGTCKNPEPYEILRDSGEWADVLKVVRAIEQAHGIGKGQQA